MKILIYGTGGVGGYFGGKLAQSGNDVTFIARGKHKEAIIKNGLIVKSVKGDFTISPANVTDNLVDLDTPDLILVCVKAGQVPDVAKSLKTLVGEKTIILPLQNGVLAPNQLIAELGKTNVLGGLCRIFSQIEGYGVINHSGFEPSITFGELSNEQSQRVKQIQQVFQEADINSHVAQDIQVEMWKKFLFICTTSSVGSITRATIGVMRSIPESRQLLKSLLTELYKVGSKKGVNLPDNIVSKTLDFIDTLPEGATASMQRDIMAGRPSELKEQTGALVKFGKELNIDTPVSSLIYSCLLPMEIAARG